MTASITSLTARRAITEAEKVLAGPRLKALIGHTAASDILPISAPLLEQLLTLARGATEIAEHVDAVSVPTARIMGRRDDSGPYGFIKVPVTVTSSYPSGAAKRITIATRHDSRRFTAWLEATDPDPRMWVDLGDDVLRCVDGIEVVTSEPGRRVTATIELLEPS